MQTESLVVVPAITWQFENPESMLPVIDLQNVQLTEATFNAGIYKVTESTVFEITANMLPSIPELVIPAGEMVTIVEKILRGNPVDELRFDAVITAADGETPAKLSVRMKLPTGNYLISAARLNEGLKTIGAPFRLAFEPVDIDSVVAV